jgi:dolichol-phosphate mannosyltransferase
MERRPADLTIVVPTYNERDGLAELVRRVFAAAEAAAVRLEVVVVDDNSPDGTGAVADDLARTQRVIVVHRAGKLGLGSAVIEGFRKASADVVGVMDADFSHPPALVPSMLRVLEAARADLVVASRYVPGGSTPDWPFARRVMSRLACVLAWPLSPIRDATSGFFLMRRAVATSVEIKAAGFKVCLELLVRVEPACIVEMPFQFEDRAQGESKMSLREVVAYLVQLKHLYWLRASGRRRPAPEYRRFTPADVARAVERIS